MDEKNMPVKSFCSWSGGKDSCLALYKAMKQGYEAVCLLCMMIETGDRSRSHGISGRLLDAQSEALGIPMVRKSATWADYEKTFLSALAEFKNKGIECGIFGDMDVQAHLDWVANTCRTVGLQYFEPLWQCDRAKAVAEFIDTGFKAIIVSCNTGKMGEKYLGREISTALTNELVSTGVDAAGENGEYHTFVYDGPLFNNRIKFTPKEVKMKDGYAFLELVLKTA
ncbi:MAG: diphthine--ammonia ligase [Spirochaetales bacterium]|nr:diphthine--ammonia ligase [Spirochaetales bacterium]